MEYSSVSEISVGHSKGFWIGPNMMTCIVCKVAGKHENLNFPGSSLRFWGTWTWMPENQIGSEMTPFSLVTAEWKQNRNLFCTHQWPEFEKGFMQIANLTFYLMYFRNSFCLSGLSVVFSEAGSRKNKPIWIHLFFTLGMFSETFASVISFYVQV